MQKILLKGKIRDALGEKNVDAVQDFLFQELIPLNESLESVLGIISQQKYTENFFDFAQFEEAKNMLREMIRITKNQTA